MTDSASSLVPIGTANDVLDISAIQRMHGNHDGTVVFRTTERTIGSIPCRELDQLLPQFVHLLTKDAYFSVCGFFEAKYIKEDSRVVGLNGTRIPQAVWGRNHLRWLTAAWVDLDCYNAGITVGRAIGAVVDIVDQGSVPPPSLYVDSGRGLWVFWLLREQGHPIRAGEDWENTDTWDRIQRQLARRLSDIEPDYGAQDAARVTRIPGSINGKSDRRVVYHWTADQHNQPFFYGLHELASMLNVRITLKGREHNAYVDPVARERGVRGHAALNRTRMARLTTLINYRGRTPEGCRSRTAALLASFMHRCKRDDILNRLIEFGREQCSPPLTRSEIQSIHKQRRKMARISDSKIGDWLQLTEAEAELTGWPAKGAHNADTDAPRKASEKRAQRRSLIRSMIPEGSTSVPTLRQIRDYLDQHGASGTLTTISNDLVALGIVNPRSDGEDGKADSTPILDGIVRCGPDLS